MSNCNKDLQAKNVPYPRTCAACGLGPCKRYPAATTGKNVVSLRTGAVVAEWDVKMRMIFGGSRSFEFDLPSMSMDPKSAEELIDAFRAAVDKANEASPSHEMGR